MRIGELAALAGTTPRAVRHYHHLGLLGVPPTVRGRREYGTEHLARLLRIRWLAGGGLPLARIAELLATDSPGGDRDSVLHDLRSVRRGIEEQRRELDEQARRVDELIARAEQGESLSPLPGVLARFYDDLEAAVLALGGDARPLRSQRQILLVMAGLGMVPASIAPYVEDLDEADRNECARLFVEFARLTEPGSQAGQEEAAALAEKCWALMLRHKERALAFMADLPSGPLGHAMWELNRVLLASAYPGPVQRSFTVKVLELILTDPDFAATIRRSTGEERPRL